MRLIEYYVYSLSVGEPGFEPELNPPEGLVLPLHYSPNIIIILPNISSLFLLPYLLQILLSSLLLLMPAL